MLVAAGLDTAAKTPVLVCGRFNIAVTMSPYASVALSSNELIFSKLRLSQGRSLKPERLWSLPDRIAETPIAASGRTPGLRVKHRNGCGF